MRKKTVYNVSGVLDTKPENLPEGLKVDELEVDSFETLEIGPFHFADSGMNANGVFIRENKEVPNRHLTKEQTRKLRDFLNMVLEEPVKTRVVKDTDGDVWFEFEPDKFTLGGEHDNPESLNIAKRKKASSSGYHGKSLEWLNEHAYFGPVTFIENTWE